MARTGRPPIDPKVLELRGTFRKDRHVKPAPVVAGDAIPELPRPPKIFDGVARAVWSRAGAELLRRGLLTGGAMDHFAEYCLNVSKAVRAEKTLSKQGTTYTTPTGFPRTRPEVAIARDCWAASRIFAQAYGLTPSGTNGSAPTAPAAAGDEDEGFLFGTKTG